MSPLISALTRRRAESVHYLLIDSCVVLMREGPPYSSNRARKILYLVGYIAWCVDYYTAGGESESDSRVLRAITARSA